MAITKKLNGRLQTYGAAGDTIAGNTCVRKILWEKPSTAGHNVDFKDGSGNALFSLWCTVTNSQFELDFGDNGFWIDGLELDVVDSGTVHVFII